MTERWIVALGGNALTEDPHGSSLVEQRRLMAATARHVARLRARGAAVVVTHGNGPQVGLRLQERERGADGAEPALDVVGAETQGAMGYQLQQALGDALRAEGLDDRVATVVTQVVVDREDPAFARPEKPIGRAYSAAEARARSAELGWALTEQPGRGWRRVVASPRPRRIVEAWAVQALAADGAMVVACGGGGVPVVEGPDGLGGVAAVVDKDRASALLAAQIDAERLVFATGVPQLYLDYAGPNQRPVSRLTAAEAGERLRAGEFPPGSMGPKIEAAIAFLEAGGREVLITSPERLGAALAGDDGTRIVR